MIPRRTQYTHTVQAMEAVGLTAAQQAPARAPPAACTTIARPKTGWRSISCKLKDAMSCEICATPESSALYAVVHGSAAGGV